MNPARDSELEGVMMLNNCTVHSRCCVLLCRRRNGAGELTTLHPSDTRLTWQDLKVPYHCHFQILIFFILDSGGAEVFIQKSLQKISRKQHS